MALKPQSQISLLDESGYSNNFDDADLEELQKKLTGELEEPESPEEDLNLKYQLPLKNGEILSRFVSKEQAVNKPGSVASLSRHPDGHPAIDVIVPGSKNNWSIGMGVPVYPIGPGTVISVENNPKSGKGGINCKIKHFPDENLISYYAHLSQINVAVGDKVTQNTVIGKNGDTGSAKGTAPHVHLSTKIDNVSVDPLSKVIGKPVGSFKKSKASSNSALDIYKMSCLMEELIIKNS